MAKITLFEECRNDDDFSPEILIKGKLANDTQVGCLVKIDQKNAKNFTLKINLSYLDKTNPDLGYCCESIQSTLEAISDDLLDFVEKAKKVIKVVEDQA